MNARIENLTTVLQMFRTQPAHCTDHSILAPAKISYRLINGTASLKLRFLQPFGTDPDKKRDDTHSLPFNDWQPLKIVHAGSLQLQTVVFFSAFE